MFSTRFARAKAPLVALILIGAYVASAWISLQYFKGPDGHAALYTANAFLLSGLMLLRGRWRIVCLVGSMMGCALVVWARGSAPVFALGTGMIAGVASLTGALIAQRVLPQPRLKNIGQALKLLAFVAAPAALTSAVLSSIWLYIRTGSPLLPGALHWFAASFVGVAMVLPAMLILDTPSTRRPRPGVAEYLAFAAVMAAILAAPYLGLFNLGLILAFPAANLFAIRLGGKATAIGVMVLTIANCFYPLHRIGTMVGSPFGELASKLIALQIYTVVVFYNGILTAFAIDQMTRVKRQLERRTAMARTARAKAIDASRAKTEFLATMSHEVRTPLNSILGFSQLLDRRDDLAQDARHQVGMIQRSGESLLTIVNDILDFSRVEAGKLALDPRPTNLLMTANDALAIVGPVAEQKGLKVGMATTGAIDRCHFVDDHRIRQVLLNFLNNAVKFTETGQVRLELSVEPQDDGHDTVRIAVADTGVGIAAEAQDRLFERFSQADSSISRSYGGTGLGLSICKGLVELMGGRVGVESVVGEGSTFWLEVPLQSVAAVEDAAGAVGEDEAIGAHILLVDDNAANRELGATVLALLGCTTDLACDGHEAIAAVKTRHYDLILMDVHMPGMDGLAATRAIRKLEAAAGIPIIAMSADVLPEQIDRCRAAGMVDSVAKPINVQHLYDCLAKWLAPDETTADTGEMAA